MKIMIFSLVLFTSAWAQANTHMFYCALTNQEPRLQVYFEIESDAVKTNIGKFQSAKIGMADSTWQILEQAQVQANITWGIHDGKTEITGVDIDMGRSGHISFSRNENGGFVKANLMSLNYPQGVQFNACMYFLSTGPKPGMTGSN